MLKKLTSKNAAAIGAVILLILGACDLTITENSHLMPIITSVSETISGVLTE